MKRLLFQLVVIISFAACKKITKEELQQANVAAGNSTSIIVQPVPPYKWRSRPVPTVFSSGIPNPIDGTNFVSQLTTGTYCSVVQNFGVYKMNSSTKAWELQEGDLARGKYIFSYQDKMYFFGEGSIFRSVKGPGFASETLAPFPGREAIACTAFVIGNKGYVTSGYIGDEYMIDEMWEYNFTTDQWTKRGRSPLGARAGITAIVVGAKAYLGLGYDIIMTTTGQKTKMYKNDWILYDPTSIYFSQKASFPGPKRAFAKGFVINNTPHVGFGFTNNGHFNDFWKYNVSSNTWTQLNNCPGQTITQTHEWTRENYVSAFSIGDKGFVVKGILAEFWEYSNSLF